MTNQKKNKEIQPIRFTTETNHTKYAFDDKEILELMEKHHTPRAGNKKNQEDHQFSAAVERIYMKAAEDAGNKHFSPLMNNTITMEEVKDTFHRNKDAPGTDRVTASLLDKADREKTKRVLHRIWNLAWKIGSCPDAWKLEHRAIFPKDSDTDPHQENGYRTVL